MSMAINECTSIYQKGPMEPLKQQEQAERAAEEGAPEHSANLPNQDRYVSSEEPTALGLYQPKRTAEGDPVIAYDRPAEKSSPSCTANTDRVEAEIKRLKQKKAELQQQIAQAANDPERQSRLQKQLSQIESELLAKDNDSYKRQHTQFRSESAQ